MGSTKNKGGDNQPASSPDEILAQADKTGLIWPGRCKEIERVWLPFQTIDTLTRLARALGVSVDDLIK